MLKISLLLRNLQTLQENNSRIFRIKNAKFSWYCFYMNTNILEDFQICISVPLIIQFRVHFLLHIKYEEHYRQYLTKASISSKYRVQPESTESNDNDLIDLYSTKRNTFILKCFIQFTCTNFDGCQKEGVIIFICFRKREFPQKREVPTLEETMQY